MHLQGAVNPNDPDATKSAHLLVCWKSGTVIIRKRRFCKISRSLTTTGDETWHERWQQRVTQELQEIDATA